ncbi:hypothetical protein GCM10023149_14300 [Mucilaginibacter gynuensis]|uniref:Outer membrane beta-barrel porin/alpha-amylase n=1 Tax=Mucilaginibacter gynuensis TaxID=1302236 RepID=A0ABP8G440_9SPHI
MRLHHFIKNTFTLTISCLLFSSCATLLLQERSETITVHTEQPATITVNKTSVETIKNKAKFKVEKSKKPLRITVETDSAKQAINIKAKNAFTYYMDMVYFGSGLVVINNPKRFTYPSHIYIKQGDTSLRYNTFSFLHKKGDVLLHVSTPYINIFRMHPKNEGIQSNAGYMGISFGLDYYHSKNQFINLTTSAALDFEMIVPAVVHYGKAHEHMETSWLSLSNNHKIKRLSLGYGLSYNRNTWVLHRGTDTTDVTTTYKNKTNYAMGVVFNGYWQFSKTFNIGVIYRPSFIGLRNSPSTYEHLISFDFAWKIPL